MKRICTECHQNIIFDKQNINEVIKFENKYFHYDCFINACKRKSSNPHAAPKWGVALGSIDKIQKDTRDFFKCNDDIERDEIYNFIVENYNVEVVPPYVFIKLNEIYSGTRKNMPYKIPPEDLLDMWKRKKANGFLDRTRAKNIAKGKNMNTVQQINYDLAVLVNQYDSYLKWKEQNKLLEQSANEEKNKQPTQKIDYDKLSVTAKKKEQEEDIDSLLDELFG